MEQAFASMGSNMLIVLPGSTSTGGAMGGFGSQPTLTWDDLEAIRREIPIGALRPPRSMRTSAAGPVGGQNWSTSVTGTTPDYFAIRSWPVAQGQPHHRDRRRRRAPRWSCSARRWWSKLFGAGVDPIGQLVRIKNVPFTVVGVLAKKGQSPSGPGLRRHRLRARSPPSTQKIQGGLKNFIDRAASW